VVHKFPLSVRQVRPSELPREFPEQNRAGIMNFQGFLEAESRKESGRRSTLRESRIQQAIAAERKSPACEDAADITAAGLRGGGRGIRPARKEQGRRRSIPLTALPAPDIKIGLRRPVECIVPRDFAVICDPFHSRQKKLRPPFAGGIAATQESFCLVPSAATFARAEHLMSATAAACADAVTLIG
jgi:hypothetical protein